MFSEFCFSVVFYGKRINSEVSKKLYFYVLSSLSKIEWVRFPNILYGRLFFYGFILYAFFSMRHFFANFQLIERNKIGNIDLAVNNVGFVLVC